MYVSLCTTCMPGVHGVQKMVLVSLEVELQSGVKHHVGTSVYQIKANCNFISNLNFLFCMHCHFQVNIII